MKTLSGEQKAFRIEIYDEKNLFLRLGIGNTFLIEIKGIYGNEISDYLFHSSLDIRNLIKNKYDDLWLFQLLSIEERHSLLKHGNNAILSIKKELKAKDELRESLNNLIQDENREIKNIESSLSSLEMDLSFIPNNRKKEEYLLRYFIGTAGEIL